jgi:hypothetical protein
MNSSPSLAAANRRVPRNYGRSTSPVTQLSKRCCGGDYSTNEEPVWALVDHAMRWAIMSSVW